MKVEVVELVDEQVPADLRQLGVTVAWGVYRNGKQIAAFQLKDDAYRLQLQLEEEENEPRSSKSKPKP